MSKSFFQKLAESKGKTTKKVKATAPDVKATAPDVKKNSKKPSK